MDKVSRYRNLSVLVLVIFGQLVLLAYQVKSNQDTRLIRVWAVSAITPVARVIEAIRSSVVSTAENYIRLHNVMAENRKLKEELGRLKVENQHLKSELATADRARALSAFQSRTPSRTIAARVIGTGIGATSRVVFVDRGSTSGVMRGMAVVSPDGIVGKVIAAYPTASQVLLITDPTFAAGVISEKQRVRGTLKGQGHSSCRVDYVQNEEKVEPGEWFYTSGDDRVFPKGLPVGTVSVVREGNPFREVYVVPSGLQGGLEEVLIVLEGVHQDLPEGRQAAPGIHLLPPPPDQAEEPGVAMPKGPATDADRLRERYRALAEAQGHKIGEGLPGSKPPDFNLDLSKPRPGAPVPKPEGGAGGQAPSAQGAGTGREMPAAKPAGPGDQTAGAQASKPPVGSGSRPNAQVSTAKPAGVPAVKPDSSPPAAGPTSGAGERRTPTPQRPQAPPAQSASPSASARQP